jgi:glycine C-acetyltransferase
LRLKTFRGNLHHDIKLSILDIFERIKHNRGPLGKHSKESQGYFMFPKLEGPISNKMTFRGKEVLTWSINNYIGLANHPEIREADAKAAADWGMGYPMGARMMSGHTKYHEQLEQEIAKFMRKEDCFLYNYGYQGIMSTVDSLLSRNDVAVYDEESHACLMDGLRMHAGKRFVFPHNDIAALEDRLNKAKKIT